MNELALFLYLARSGHRTLHYGYVLPHTLKPVAICDYRFTGQIMSFAEDEHRLRVVKLCMNCQKLEPRIQAKLKGTLSTSQWRNMWYQLTGGNTVATNYDQDPEAIKWARDKVQHHLDRIERMSKSPTLDEESRRGWRKAAHMIRMDLLGGEGCVIASFDERLPELSKMLEGKDL